MENPKAVSLVEARARAVRPLASANDDGYDFSPTSCPTPSRSLRTNALSGKEGAQIRQFAPHASRIKACCQQSPNHDALVDVILYPVVDHLVPTTQLLLSEGRKALNGMIQI